MTKETLQLIAHERSRLTTIMIMHQRTGYLENGHIPRNSKPVKTE